MNKTDVVTQVSNNTGFDTEVCEKVINTFEDQCGDALANKFRGIKNNKEVILTGISEKTDIALEDCGKIITAFEDVLSAGLSNKLKFFKRNE